MAVWFADLIQYTEIVPDMLRLLHSLGIAGIKTHHALMQGRYCLRAAMRNDAAKDMGFSMEATLTGSGIIKMDVATLQYNHRICV